MIIKFWVFDKHFFENEVSLSLQGKLPTMFATNNKM
jgi:hypothetical protein